MVCLKRSLIVFLLFLAVYWWACDYGVTEYFQSSSDPILDELRDQLAVLHPKFQKVRISEADKSYTINKKHVYICVKDGHGRYYNRNMLCYVILHEYAHMLCDEIGHTRKFYRIFDELLEQATEKGLYDPNIPPLNDYCGHK